MKLSALLKGWAEIPPQRDAEIGQLTLDSRTVKEGCLFLAVPGAQHDGRQFIHGALARGAAAVVYEQDGSDPAIDHPLAFGVPKLRTQLGLIADRFYGSPSKRLKVVGVTGTNGKTTTTHLLAQVFEFLGGWPSPPSPLPEGPHPFPSPGGRGEVGVNPYSDRGEPSRARGARHCGIIGTLGTGFPGALDPSLHTTPDALSVHRLFGQLAADGARAVCMEVSSHALDQARVAGVAFDIAVFTNLTRDHLDYHGDMDSYAAAKARLFDFPHLTGAVINADDSFGRALIERARCPVLSFGFDSGDVRATRVQPDTSGITLQVTTPQGATEIKSPLLGRFNASNLLAVLAVLLMAGVPLNEAAAALARAQPVAGRMERFGGDSQPLVVVDYAHTPDALEKALAALREHTRGRLVCVFGCGGDRDRGKRPQMGAIAERLADWVIVTNDNPRHEQPMTIMHDIVAGMQAEPTIVPDRVQAIQVALAECAAGDTVLVAGKGHEDYQQIGSVRHPYSDRATVQQLLREAA